MYFASVLQGLFVGFSTAAPVGPIGLLCIQNTLSRGIVFGVICGLGAATADMLYGILVAMGLQPLTNLILTIRTPLTICGSLFLIYMGLKKIWAPAATQAAELSSNATKHLIQAYLSTCFLTITNPATILDFMALFTSLRLDLANYIQSLQFVGGVFLGSAAWWLTLCGIVGICRKHVSQPMIIGINYGAGALICGFGLWVLFKTLG